MTEPLRASHCFSSREVGWLHELLVGLMRGADARVLARAKQCKSVTEKVVVMRARLEANRALRGEP